MNLASLSIEDLAALRDRVLITLADKVAARQKDLLAESRKGSGRWSPLSLPQLVLSGR
jgi:hypothetical protein